MNPELHTKLGLHTGHVTADRYVGRAYSFNEVDPRAADPDERRERSAPNREGRLNT